MFHLMYRICKYVNEIQLEDEGGGELVYGGQIFFFFFSTQERFMLKSPRVSEVISVHIFVVKLS